MKMVLAARAKHCIVAPPNHRRNGRRDSLFEHFEYNFHVDNSLDKCLDRKKGRFPTLNLLKQSAKTYHCTSVKWMLKLCWFVNKSKMFSVHSGRQWFADHLRQYRLGRGHSKCVDNIEPSDQCNRTRASCKYLELNKVLEDHHNERDTSNLRVQLLNDIRCLPSSKLITSVCDGSNILESHEQSKRCESGWGVHNEFR